MDYKHYSAEDFAADSSFIEWVKRSDREKAAFWETWLAQNPDKAEDVALAHQLVNLWQIQSPVPSKGSFANVWEKIQADRTEWEEKAANHRTRHFFTWRHYRLAAAIFLGLLIIGVAFYQISDGWRNTRYTTREGETKTIVLPDGSTVVLNAHSTLKFADDWSSGKAREVELSGEAFFSVTHRPNHQAFLVKTADQLQVEVLGTVFTVSEHNNNTQVVLNSGKISLRTDRSTPPLLMKPGELVQVSKSREMKIMRRKVNPEVYSAWKDNQFVFDNTSLGEIAAIVERNFGYRVQFADPTTKEKRMTIRIPNRDLELLLTALAEAHDLKISRKDNQILLSENSF